ncbi:class II glutamine amidotransferase [Thermotoga profunda]|uniref:class II glutamine amidotransferase n=1 Tax=Thermotoga profunda TaxID=1508420 RepID=UPI0014948CB8|nr:class II glutamine amidotransferase [Thermotoga profunda]
MIAVCRMIGFSFETEQDVGVFFKHLQSMAQNGKSAPHNHGWGVYAIKDNAVIYYRSPRPAYEEEMTSFPAKIGIFHARKASEHLPITFLQLHPFIDNRGKAFCHNGTIYDIEYSSIDSDTYSYFLKIKDFSNYEDLTNKIGEIAQNYRHTGMNFLMINNDELVVYCGYSGNKDYYTLWYRDTNGFVVSSEPMDQRFKPIDNKTLLVVKDGKIEQLRSI